MIGIRKSIPLLAFVLVLSIFPAMASAWDHQVTSSYDYKSTSTEGGGWTKFSVSSYSGNIKINHDQYGGNAYCHVRLGEKFTTPSGAPHYHVEFEIKYRIAYSVGSLFWGTFDLITKLELHDAAHGVDDYYQDLNIQNSYGENRDQTRTKTLDSDEELAPNTDFYLVYHLYINFDGWVWMHKHPSTEYTYGRFDLIHIYYTISS